LKICSTRQKLSTGRFSMFGKSIPVVMYHHVSPVGKGLNIRPEIFDDHLRTLRRTGWKTLSGDEFLQCLQKNEIPKKCVLLTFDDGFVDNYLYAYPLLKKNNMKAVLFVPTGFIEDADIKRDRFLPVSHDDAWELASTERRSEVICTWKELEEMESGGIFDIQSHGHSHNTPQYLKEKKYTELKEDLLISKKTLEKRFSKDILHFGWPKGKYDQTGIDIATETGFKAIYTCERGSNTRENLKALKRLPAKKDGRWLVNRLSIYSSVLLSKFYLALRTGT